MKITSGVGVGNYLREAIIISIFLSKGANIQGRQLIEGWLYIFKEIWYTVFPQII